MATSSCVFKTRFVRFYGFLTFSPGSGFALTSSPTARRHAINTALNASLRCKGIGTVALAWFWSRVLIGAFVSLGHFSSPAPTPATDDTWPGVPSVWLNPWTTFDSRHYIGIAQSGYTPQRAAFFPLYPTLMRVLSGGSTNENTLAFVGVLVSNACFFGALWLLYLLTRQEWGESVARRAVWLEAFFPVAAFSAAVYTESLFLLLSTGAFFFTRNQKWRAGALCGFVAGLTRNSGPVLFLALLLDRPEEPLSRSGKWKQLAVSLCPLIAFIAVQAFLRTQPGAGAGSLAAQREFGRVASFPLVPLLLDARALFSPLDVRLRFEILLQLGATVGTFALLAKYRRRFSPGKSLFLALILAASLTLGWTGLPHTISTSRYLFGTFPFVQLLALWSIESVSSRRATLYLALMGAALFALHCFFFGSKNFLG